jgi:hypothetical protein
VTSATVIMSAVRCLRLVTTSFNHSHNHSLRSSISILALKDSDSEEKRKELIFQIATSSSTCNVAELYKTKGGVKLAMQTRVDLMSMVAERKKAKLDCQPLTDLDQVIKQFLQSAFCFDSLQLKRITFENSSGNVLEKVARGESVHRVRSLSELKRRLHDGRRCFALFHSCLPEEPLVFVHVGLASDLAKAIVELDTYKAEEQPTHAMFYSINSPITALRGINLFSS